MKNNKRTNYVIIAILVLVVGISIGYAALSATLTITGNTTIQGNTWDVHFQNLQVNTDSTAVPATNGDAVIANESGATTGITAVESTRVNYTVTFNKPGDFYEFTVVVKNGGTLPAKLSADPTISGFTGRQAAVTTYTVTDVTDAQNPRTLSIGDQLAPNGQTGDSKTLKVHVEYNKDIANDQLLGADDDRTATLTYSMNFVQGD